MNCVRPQYPDYQNRPGQNWPGEGCRLDMWQNWATNQSSVCSLLSDIANSHRGRFGLKEGLLDSMVIGGTLPRRPTSAELSEMRQAQGASSFDGDN